MKTIKGVATYIVDNKEILIVSREYTGSPIIAHIPDLLLISRETLDIHRKTILFANKIRIEFIDEEEKDRT